MECMNGNLSLLLENFRIAFHSQKKVLLSISCLVILFNVTAFAFFFCLLVFV